MKKEYNHNSHGNLPSELTNQQVHANTETNGHNNLFLNPKNKIMLKQKTLLTALMVTFLTIFMVGCQKDDDSSIVTDLDNKDQSILISISSKEVKKEYSFWQNLVDVASGNVQHVSFSFSDQNGNITEHGGGKSFENNQIVRFDQIANEVHSEYNQIGTFLDNQQQYSDQSEMSRTKQELQEWEKMKVDISGIVFNEITLRVNKTSLEELSQIDAINVHVITEKKDIKSISNTGTISTMSSSPNWVPNSGYATTGPYSSTTRAVYNRFVWNNKPFSYHGYGYEHDFFLNNYPGTSLPGTYLSRAQNSSGIPICTWYSNMPNKYLDTRFDDSPNEVAYTIGCGQGYNLLASTSYYTHIITNFGDASSDNAKLNGQAGHQVPIGCTTTWCIFALENVTLKSAWNISVPGSSYWG